MSPLDGLQFAYTYEASSLWMDDQNARSSGSHLACILQRSKIMNLTFWKLHPHHFLKVHYMAFAVAMVQAIRGLQLLVCTSTLLAGRNKLFSNAASNPVLTTALRHYITYISTVK